MKRYIPKPKFDPLYLFKLVAFFLIYFITAKFGLRFYAVHNFATTVWPPTGIAISALILYGYDLWPAITVGAFVVNLTTGAAPLVAVGIALGNTLEAVIGTYLLNKNVNLYRCFERLRDTILFIGLVALLSTTISATIGVLSLLFGHTIALIDIIPTWSTWWIGDTLGALVIAPFLITHLWPTRPWNNASLKWYEIAGGYTFLVISNFIIFWHPIGQIQNGPLLYLILFPLLWSGIRFGTRGMTSSIFITSVIAVVSTSLGHGPFAISPTSNGLLYLQIFLGTISITFLIFIAVVKERKLSMEKLQEHVVELELAVKKISSADQAKNDFLAILAHELRNPLAPILSSLELMRLRLAERAEDEHLLKTVETHVHTITHLLDDLLDISRISKRKLKLEKETFILRRVIVNSIETADPLMKAKEHRFLVSEPKEIVWVVGDPLRIEQIIVNLLINAAKYTPRGGKIQLSWTIEDKNVVMRVVDNGIGIAPVMIKRIFEPFLQANKEESGIGGGLGIGLSLTKKLVELHGGNISAKSAGSGMGSEFTVTLPIPDNIQLPMNIPEEAEKIEPALLQNIISNKKYKILVIDDNKAAADGLRELLHYKGHTTESSYEGVNAIEVIQKSKPEVIILDIGLPNISGYDVAQKIRKEIPEKLTLIALTGYGQEEDRVKALKSGFDYHLTKPVSISDIEKILSEL